MAAPVFNSLNNTPTFTENAAAVLLDNNATVSDADIGSSTPYTGATLTLVRSTGANADDLFRGAPLSEGQVVVLGTIEDPQNPGTFIAVEIIIGTYTNADGALVITFNDQATGDRVNDVLQQLTYANASEAPPPSVVVNYTFNDGDVATGSITVTINQVNDPPSIDALAGGALYQPGSGGVVLSAGVLLSDFDSPMLKGAVVAFSGGFLGTDVLSANVGATGIVANYAGGVLTLSGTATVEQYRQVLATVTYSTTAPDPTNGGAAPDRTLHWFVTDSANADSPTLSSTLNFAPGIDLDASGAGLGFATTFAQGGAAIAIADTDADIFISAASVIGGLSVVLTNAKAGDVLAATGGPLTVTTDTSQPGRIALAITGSGSETDYENALKSVTFFNPSANVDPTTRDVTVLVSDFAGNPSLAAHSAITVTGSVNDPGSAADDTATTAANTSLLVSAPGVLANDNDPDGLVVVTGSVATSGGGVIQFQPDGSYGYGPATNFSGTDTVVYTAQDPFGNQVSATLRITVTPPPPPPPTETPGDDSFTASGSQQVNGGLGTDTVTFNFRLVDAKVTYSGNQITIENGSTHTVLTGFEIFKFTDGTVNNNDADPLVDDLFYYAKYHDVWTAHADADAHFHSTGWKEGRDPDAFFSTVVYLSANPDVKAQGVDPLAQFDAVGWKQGRVPSITFDPAAYLAANPDVQNLDPLRHYLANGYQEGRQPIAPTELIAPNGFDYVYYLNHNPDVAASGVDPLQHFQTVGWKEGRNPNALFDTKGYLANYLDVKAANVNPLDHYNQFGWHEGRDPSVGFDTTSYLSAYNDVKAANINPLNHFLDFGIHEGRSPFADGVWG